MHSPKKEKKTNACIRTTPQQHLKAMPGYLALCIEMFHNVSQCFKKWSKK
jgi:hypothetical protein